MNKKTYFWISVFVFLEFLNFIFAAINDGAALINLPSIMEKISFALGHPLYWVSPFFTVVFLLMDPFFILFYIILGVILYYVYDHFVRNKKEFTSDFFVEKVGSAEINNEARNTDSRIEFFDDKNKQKASNENMVKKGIIIGTFVVIIWTIFIFMISSGPGEGLAGIIFILPVLPIIFIFFPVYFIILSVRYSREKGNMNSLDKIMFYTLAILLVSIWLFFMHGAYSRNLTPKSDSIAADQMPAPIAQ